ncbi:unnamed protein product [Symbiodinium natans]|uniref:Uncharacterized protein n=1 Tax=Symbiodinium natans TaxID=878477 RepID=A0A812R3Y3_9DINO|nr:unnamed protein product [Symbiodinium natans]
MCSMFAQGGGTLQVEASVVYGATGERQSSATQLPVLYEGSDLQADIALADGTKVFRPGLPMRVSVRLVKPGGQIPSAQDLSGFSVRLAQEASTVSYSHRPETVYHDLAAASWKDGRQEVDVPEIQDDAACCNPAATRTTWQEHEKACGCCVTGLHFWVERKQPGDEYWQRIYTGVEGKSASGCAGRAWSPDGSYLALSAPVEDGNAWTAQLLSSRPPSDLQSNVEYFVTQAGSFVASGVAQPSFTASGTHFKASLQMVLPTTLSGELRFAVVARTSSGRAMAASSTVSRSLQLPYNLTASFSTAEAKPGTELQVQLEAKCAKRRVKAFAEGLLLGSQLAPVDSNSCESARRRAWPRARPLEPLGRLYIRRPSACCRTISLFGSWESAGVHKSSGRSRKAAKAVHAFIASGGQVGDLFQPRDAMWLFGFWLVGL